MVPLAKKMFRSMFPRGLGTGCVDLMLLETTWKPKGSPKNKAFLEFMVTGKHSLKKAWDHFLGEGAPGTGTVVALNSQMLEHQNGWQFSGMR